MPHTNRHQADRRAALCNILETGPAHTQQELVDTLTARGFEATQSSISRDLKDIGAIKATGGYSLGDESPLKGEPVADVSDLIRELKPAGPNVLVITTAIGGAQRVALALDRAAWPEIVGSIGGDDTVFVATMNASGQRGLVRRIERAVGRA
jgi:transcriptional regulator of arginine metabolism